MQNSTSPCEYCGLFRDDQFGPPPPPTVNEAPGCCSVTRIRLLKSPRVIFGTSRQLERTLVRQHALSSCSWHRGSGTHGPASLRPNFSAEIREFVARPGLRDALAKARHHPVFEIGLALHVAVLSRALLVAVRAIGTYRCRLKRLFCHLPPASSAVRLLRPRDCRPLRPASVPCSRYRSCSCCRNRKSHAGE